MEQTGFDEAAVLKKLGITYVHIPMRGSAENPYGPKALDTFAATSVSAQGKVLLHCTVAWRASHLWAAYLIRDRKVPVAADDPRRPAAALRRARADHGWRFDAS